MIVLYIDPGTGSMLISALIATLSVVFFTLKDKIYTLFSSKGDKGDQLDPLKHYGLVYYSEGKQYWNVFKPLVEEGAKRGINTLYLTSDKEDPGLKITLEHLQTIYIGSGREAYFNLNRLNADIVVMTTPGLDVLEIKRSKNVKHYVHITHATSSSGSYKAFATDYFDSVLVGGEGEVALIRELEKIRNLPKKNIEIIGHTYLDVYRDNLKIENYKYDLFEEKRTTILVSPTWGDHGLLSKYGDKILSKLEKYNQYNVIIRPHPQSFVSEKEMMDTLIEKYPNTSNRIWNTDRESLKAMYHADIMVSDFSGIIFDFYTLFKKPILTMRSQFEKRGREAMDLKEEPWDHQLLNLIGKTLEESDLDQLDKIIEETIIHHKIGNVDTTLINNVMDKYPNDSSNRGMDYLEKLLKQFSNKVDEVTDVKHQLYLNADYTFNPYELNSADRAIVKIIKALFQPSMLFQAVVGSMLLLTYIFVGVRILPNPGLNVEYLNLLKPYATKLTIALTILFFFVTLFINKGQFEYRKKIENISITDLLLILLPMTPIVQYIAANQDILLPIDSLKVFGIFFGLSIIVIVLIPWAMSVIVSKIITLPISMSFLFIVINRASFSMNMNEKNITLILILIIFLSFFIFFFRKKNILSFLIVVLFLTNSSLSISKIEEGEDAPVLNEPTLSELEEVISGKEIINKPDVFLMIYDSYANQETLSRYGYDNSEQMEFLMDNGFTIYDGTYTKGSSSLVSMSQVLNMGDVTHTLEEYRRLVSGDALGLRLFKNNGYTTHLITETSYYTYGFEPSYDSIYPQSLYSIASDKIITRAILEGEFRFDADFSNTTHADLLSVKEAILSENLKKPEFLYHHIENPGHSPNSQYPRPNEIELYIDRLKTVNGEMRKDINDMNLKGRDAIVIIAGDHGPYLTKNGIGFEGQYEPDEINILDIQDRYGAFLAIHWPKDNASRDFEIKTLQDILPAVVSYMYDDVNLYNEIKPNNKVNSLFNMGYLGIEDGVINGDPLEGKFMFEQRGIRTRIKD